MIKKIITKFFNGHERTVKAKKNIIASFAIKGVSIVVGFLMVRLTLDYLDQTKYGIWLTLSSFLTWFTFFEIGLGKGLRNKLAEAIALKDYELGRTYVSTTYAILSIVISVVALLFFIINQILDWSKILNTTESLARELNILAIIVFGFFFLRFVLKLISMVLFADQRTALANSFGPIGNLISLIVIYILTKTTSSSLIYLGFSLSFIPIIVLLVASLYFYKTKYKHLAPSIKFVNFKYSKELLNLGVKFFFIRTSALTIYQSTNIIIAQFFGLADVTVYNIAYKYFSVIWMIFAIVLSPFWSAFTEAWIIKDLTWIKSSIKKLIIVWGGLTGLGVIMLIFSGFSYHLWIGDTVKIPFQLSFALLIYFVTFTFGGIFTMFINGVSKVQLQLILTVISAFVFIIMSVFFIKVLNMGIIGLVLASIIANIEGFIIAPIQYHKIINGNADGIWNK